MSNPTDSGSPGTANNAPETTDGEDAKITGDGTQQPKDKRGSWWQPAVF